MKLCNFFLVIIFTVILGSPMHLSAEELIGLPRPEGSKSFDMEINNLNNIGIKHYSLNELEHAEKSLKKATNLAQQFRDPNADVDDLLARKQKQLEEKRRAALGVPNPTTR